MGRVHFIGGSPPVLRCAPSQQLTQGVIHQEIKY
jgi:hypothetical protein